MGNRFGGGVAGALRVAFEHGVQQGALDVLIARGLDTDREKRPPTAQAALDALNAAIAPSRPVKWIAIARLQWSGTT